MRRLRGVPDEEVLGAQTLGNSGMGHASVVLHGQDLTHAPPYTSACALSGGQQLQLAIARAHTAGPKLLLLDEPTEGIQPSNIEAIGRVIRLPAERKPMAIVLVEQFYDFAAELADRYLVMERGEIVLHGRGADMQVDGVRRRLSI